MIPKLVQTTKVGEMYYMHPSIIHQVIKCSGNTVTFVLNTKTVMLKSCFSSQQEWYSQSFKREKFTVNQLKNILNMTLKLLQN